MSTATTIILGTLVFAMLFAAVATFLAGPKGE